MLNTARAIGGVVTSPHHAASQAGRGVLRDGGSAVEAVVAMAATLAVVYPQMNSIGGDGFWIVAEPGDAPVAIAGCGRAAAAATPELYRAHGLGAVPARGRLAANTVAGAVSSWEAALRVDARAGRTPLPLRRLLQDAIGHAEGGIAPAHSTIAMIATKASELRDVPGFAELFLPGGAAPAADAVFRQPALARTLGALAEDGLAGFYRGALADRIARDLAAVGAPVAANDLAAHAATIEVPLTVRVAGAQLFNTRPPTQGVASLMILALFDRLGVRDGGGFAHVHALVEATKRAFIFRDGHVQDPDRMDVDPQAVLDDAASLDELARGIDPAHALAWPRVAVPGDTVWCGAIDARGQAASMIQSTYWEFGSGIVLPETGIVWQNRGASFRLGGTWNVLQPGMRPFHTLNPALARFNDGRTMVYGTMGGEGQPQTQAQLFTRYARFGEGLQEAVTAPRFLLGRTWGEDTTTLKLESRFDPALVERLREAGHAVELVPAFSSAMGHAGALVRHASGVMEGAADPRSDGAVATL